MSGDRALVFAEHRTTKAAGDNILRYNDNRGMDEFVMR